MRRSDLRIDVGFQIQTRRASRLHLARTSAPIGTSACRSMLGVHLNSALDSLSLMTEQHTIVLTQLQPEQISHNLAGNIVSSSARARRLRTEFHNARNKSASAMANGLHHREPCVVPLPGAPARKISRAIKSRCVSTTSPSISSVPVLITIVRIKDRAENVEHSTLNIQCQSQNANSEFNVGRWMFGVRRFLP